MKWLLGLFSGIIIAVLSPLLVSQYQDWMKQDAEVVSYSVQWPIVASKKLLEQIEKNPGSVVRKISLMNTGTEDISNASVDLVGPGLTSILAMGDVSTTDGLEPPYISFKNNRVHLQFRLMRKNEMAFFWVLMSDVEQPIVVSTKKELKVIDQYYSDDESVLSSSGFALLLTFLLGICGGILLAEIMSRHVLRKIGFDPKEISAAYAEAMKDKDT